MSWGPLYRMQKVELKAKCVKQFYDKIDSGKDIIEILERMLSLNWHPFGEADFEPVPWQAVEVLKQLMEQLQASTDGQTLAFKSEDARHVYWYKEIAALKEFKFLKQGSDRVSSYTKSMLIYDQLLPFNNENHDDNHCVPLDDLPRFYKRKGEDS